MMATAHGHQQAGVSAPWFVQDEFAVSSRRTLGLMAPFFHALNDTRLVTTRCPENNWTWFPPRPICPFHGEANEWVELSGNGRVRVAIRSHVVPQGVSFSAPYILAIIDIEGTEGAVTHRVRGADLPAPGARVSLVMVDDGGSHPLSRIAFDVDTSS